MENGTMGRMLQIGDTQVNDTDLGDLCRRYCVHAGWSVLRPVLHWGKSLPQE